MNYEELLNEAENNGIIVKEKPLKSSDGRIWGKRIAIRKNTPTVQRTCILAEELGHYYTATGDIINQGTVTNRKIERLGRIHAYNRLVGLAGIVGAHAAGCCSRYEMAAHLDVTEEFLEDALCYYRQKYGWQVKYENYVIYFEPLSILELQNQ